MSNITYIDRLTRKTEVEKVYGAKALEFLYGDDIISRSLGAPLLHSLVKFPFFSKLYGTFQDRPESRKKIRPFIEQFGVDEEEFLDSTDSFETFNAFFYRKLKNGVRPICEEKDSAVLPADGRYLFFEDITEADTFFLKQQQFKLRELLQDDTLFEKYSHGTMVLARLCPVDYHRFHFPVDGVPGDTQLINGYLYSVNPIALRKNINRLTQNRRTLCTIQTETYGDVLFMEIGATNVGSIHQTYQPDQQVRKGDEKGYFAFGGSSIILLFEKGKIQLAQDLIEMGKKGLEIRCLMGQKLGIPFVESD